MSDSNFLILTCDGGGIRGLITAMILQELDKQVPFLNKIDVFSGTSTGGIIALGLASGVPISKLVNIYANPGNCSQIFNPYNPGAKIDRLSVEKFTKSLDNSKEFAGIAEIIGIIDKLLYVKYDNTGLKNVLENNLTSPSKSLANLDHKVLVTTFQLDNTADPNNQSWRPLTLDNLPNNLFNSQDTSILDAALCTSAAPTYFPPYQHPSYGLCVDGGVFANNPSILALARVLGSGILGKRNIQNIRMLSIGTGTTQSYLPPSYQPDGPLRYGPATWLWPEAVGHTPRIPLLSILMDGSSILDDFEAEMLLGEQQYQRINVQLTENIPLDGCSNIGNMQRLVNSYVGSPEWNKKKEWVKNNFLQ
ncbi:patatin-like phospholipase family protein [Okeania sp. KiyG1]|uniref:patatin-like phospholipase family protein n=1 Tax=Okeania sp. KiyG1 TaxID=2720165 RepID=UPI0019230B13|nr:patatin-like phospholipase family protein [Okeania sp. KiyG1]GGA18432.1 patatin [Okeania sp. KiyG1]